jgi:hypothetical protein
VTAGRRALRAWLVAAPVFLACSAVAPGGLFRERGYVDVDLYGRYAEGLLDGQIPYRDVFVEYPPGAFLALVPPALVTDDHYRTLFKVLMALAALGGLWCVIRLLVALGASRRRLVLAAGFVGVSPLLLGSVWLNSYDAWPAALTAACLLALASGYVVLGFVCLTFAAAAKVYAVVLVGPALAFVHARSGWRGVTRAAGGLGVGVAVAVAPFLAVSPGGVWASISAQAERGLHVESLGASVLLALDRLDLYTARVAGGSTSAKSRDVAGALPDAVATGTSLLAVLAVLAVWVAYARGPRDIQRLAVASAAGVCAVLAFGKVFSPQYAEWLLFLVPLAAGIPGVVATVLAGASFLLARLWFHEYARVFSVDGIAWLVLFRNAALVACFATLLWSLAQGRRNEGASV